VAGLTRRVALQIFFFPLAAVSANFLRDKRRPSVRRMIVHGSRGKTTEGKTKTHKTRVERNKKKFFSFAYFLSSKSVRPAATSDLFGVFLQSGETNSDERSLCVIQHFHSHSRDGGSTRKNVKSNELKCFPCWPEWRDKERRAKRAALQSGRESRSGHIHAHAFRCDAFCRGFRVSN
jgi:hypothetical protein